MFFRGWMNPGGRGPNKLQSDAAAESLFRGPDLRFGDRIRKGILSPRRRSESR